MRAFDWHLSLLDRAHQLRIRSEAERFTLLQTIFAENAIDRRHTEAAIFEAAYGDGTGRGYWSTFLSEPVLPDQFARLLSLSLGQEDGKVEVAHVAVARTLIEMSQDGVLPPIKQDTTQDTFWIIGKKIKPKFVTDWLLSKPLRKDLVPPSLAALISPIVPIPAPPIAPPAHVSTKKRGQPPALRQRVVRDMRAALARGEDLKNQTEESMATQFGASRGTCRVARAEVLSSNRTID